MQTDLPGYLLGCLEWGRGGRGRFTGRVRHVLASGGAMSVPVPLVIRLAKGFFFFRASSATEIVQRWLLGRRLRVFRKLMMA